MKRSEAAMVEAIRSWDIDEATDEGLLRVTVAVAMARPWNYRPQSPLEIAGASSLLPLELQRVLQMPTALRQCFVLCLLMSVPRNFCAWLLGIHARKVDQDASLAAQMVVRIIQAEKAA